MAYSPDSTKSNADESVIVRTSLASTARSRNQPNSLPTRHSRSRVFARGRTALLRPANVCRRWHARLRSSMTPDTAIRVCLDPYVSAMDCAPPALQNAVRHSGLRTIAGYNRVRGRSLVSSHPRTTPDGFGADRCQRAHLGSRAHAQSTDCNPRQSAG
jgi:hypothetical protein